MRLLTAVFLFSAFHLFGQSTDQQLANLYYGQGEYAKAAEYYGKFVSKNSPRVDVLHYTESLEKSMQGKEAEKTLKKWHAIFPDDMEYTLALGELYERSDKKDQANKLYSELIKESAFNGSAITNVATAFRKSGKYDLALKALEAGRKELKKSYPLNVQFAELYYATGKTNDMIDEYFSLLDEYPSYRQSIEETLSRQIDFSSADESQLYNTLREKLLTRIQKKPDEAVYAEMLTWLYIQKREFRSALMQVEALDRREQGMGARVLDVAPTFVENKDYRTAKDAYRYVLDQGESSPFYGQAYSSLLNVNFREITFEKKFTQEDIRNAVSDYRGALRKIGWNARAVPIACELAEIEGYYANDAKGAEQLLDSCMKVPGLTDIQRAEVKMQLGDILVLEDDIWQASLYYMQVDKDFKYEPIGHEAKFKNARIFYYDGDFYFAQSQLDVLKQSTSRLIANDAMQLSILITDNLGLDSNYTAMNLFAHADLLLEQHQFDAAFEKLDSINLLFPDHGLADEILFRKGLAMESQGKWEQAIAYYEQIEKKYHDDILGDDAIFHMGDIYQNHLNDNEKAAEEYKKILFDFKGSLLTVEARKRFRILRGDKSAEEPEP